MSAEEVSGCNWYRFVGKIVEDSPADRSGALHVGDRILSVNNVAVSHLHHEHIVNMIKESGLTAVLTVGPPGAQDIALPAFPSRNKVPTSREKSGNFDSYSGHVRRL